MELDRYKEKREAYTFVFWVARNVLLLLLLLAVSVGAIAAVTFPIIQGKPPPIERFVPLK